MGQPAAKKGDKVMAVDVHNVVMPNGAVTPMPGPFVGQIAKKVAKKVKIEGKPAAVKGSKAKNQPPHIPAGVNFQKSPKNEGEITKGSKKVKLGGKPAARMGDMAKTCSDVPGPPGSVIAPGMPKVLIG